jgi:hypothetical protein
VPIPTYDNKNPKHLTPAQLGKDAENLAATVDVSGARTFQAARKLVRDHLAETGLEAQIMVGVMELLLEVAEKDG